MNVLLYSISTLLNSSFIYIFVFIVALCLGSFLNVVIARLPRQLQPSSTPYDADINTPHSTASTPTSAPCHSLLWPRSQCQSCKTTLKTFDLIPVISYALLRATCRYCKKPISMRYPLVECLTAIMVTSLFVLYGINMQAVAVALLSLFLISLACIDLETGLLPDRLTLGGLWLGLLFSLNNTLVSPQQAILGAALGYSFLSVINYAYFIFRKRYGMGMGDCKYLAMLGAWLGPLAMLYIILCASCLAILFNICTLFYRKKLFHTEIAFGPYLSLAALFILLLRLG